MKNEQLLSNRSEVLYLLLRNLFNARCELMPSSFVWAASKLMGVDIFPVQVLAESPARRDLWRARCFSRVGKRE